ncbi:MAG: lipoyl synthase [Candidatus Pacebacteria bacterium]|nr:lipoyl synthase [Candidatus Paceibacterota bacterium]
MERTNKSTDKSGRLPPWLKVSLRGAGPRNEVRTLLRELQLNTVCESAHCPNLCECWRRRTATIMILGNVCSRDCRFCAVPHGIPEPPDPGEADRVVEAASKLGLKYVVLTSVTRDDLPDGGAGHFARVTRALREYDPKVGVEVLTPDFFGRRRDIETVIQAAPNVFNHNVETCARLTPQIRSGADYGRSLAVLGVAAELGSAHKIKTKSGLMLGLGETDCEIRETLIDLRERGVSFVTLGQYLPPSSKHWPVARYVHPDEFEKWRRIAENELGFDVVASGPLVRSSYHAEEALRTALH